MSRLSSPVMQDPERSAPPQGYRRTQDHDSADAQAAAPPAQAAAPPAQAAALPAQAAALPARALDHGDAGTAAGAAPAAAKARWRTRLLSDRQARPAAARAAARNENAAHLLAALRPPQVRTVCGYLPLASEPIGASVLDELVAAGMRVLVPIVAPGEPLDWCDYPAATIPGSFGIAEPTGRRLGAVAVGLADVVLVPALAVDARGTRLGRGAGHYDRSLVAAATSARLIAPLFDNELVEVLPVEELDRPVNAVVTPGGGLARIG